MTSPLLRAAILFGILTLAGLPLAPPAGAQSESSPTPTPPPPATSGATRYDDKLLRLAEVLGSLQYLRNLCGESGETVWREMMEKLLATEAPDDDRRHQRLTASYNRGFRTFASVYTSCSDAAAEAEARYRREGGALTAEIVARYGN
jgi:uncharacterized protein (TIGR02301 family)